ncbi:kinase-like domain-containing protein [Xylaria scruposa]|nr:kinase-like domain-containing protein [Xylaria scruposa]
MPWYPLSPDDTLLEQIFGAHQPENISFYLQGRYKCIFKATFAADIKGSHPPCVARLEVRNEYSIDQATVASMQQIARSILPDLVPKTIRTGTATNSAETTFNFWLTEFVDGDVLEDVWEKLDPDEQNSIAIAIAEAVRKLHRCQLQIGGANETKAKNSPGSTDFNIDRRLFGGPHTGFLTDGSALIDTIMQRWKLIEDSSTKHHVSESRGIKIQSNYEDLGSVFIKTSELEQWPNEAVFCHNDLTPDNIIIKPHTSLDGNSHYELAAIIDWELAGFYPPSYELGLQDTYLSTRNLRLSFYLLLKKHLKELVPRSSSQIALCKAMDILWESRHRLLNSCFDIPSHIRERFLENFCLVRDEDPYTGLVHDPNEEGPWDYSKDSTDKLQDDVTNEAAGRAFRDMIGEESPGSTLSTSPR